MFWKIHGHHTRLKISQNIAFDFLPSPRPPAWAGSNLSLAVDFQERLVHSCNTGNFQYFSSSALFFSPLAFRRLHCVVLTQLRQCLAPEAWAGSGRLD